MRSLRRLAVLGTVAGALVAALLVPPALSTPGSGVSAAVIAKGKAVDKIKTKAKKFDVVVQEITIAPGGHSGWHSHPGQAIVVIESGTFTTYRAGGDDDDDDDEGDEDDGDAKCKKKVYKAGEVYVDPGYGKVHIARNESASENLVLTVTYIDVPVGGAFRIDHPAACTI